MRSYGQYCAAARALDLVGDRWTLLVVRELLLRDCRFTDLRRGLPGVATNLLTERLRELEAAGLVERVDAPPPVATTLYRLTDRGRDLAPVLRELTRWGLPEMLRGAGDDAQSVRWGVGAIPLFYDGADLAGIGPYEIAVEAAGERLRVAIDAEDRLAVALGGAEAPDTRLSGPAEHVLAAFAGFADRLDELRIEGDRRRLRRLVSRATTGLAAG